MRVLCLLALLLLLPMNRLFLYSLMWRGSVFRETKLLKIDTEKNANNSNNFRVTAKRLQHYLQWQIIIRGLFDLRFSSLTFFSTATHLQLRIFPNEAKPLDPNSVNPSSCWVLLCCPPNILAPASHSCAIYAYDPLRLVPQANEKSEKQTKDI